MAKEFGIDHYNAPAGGCVLTEPNFSRRAKAFVEYRGKEELDIEKMRLFRFGRHFWPESYLHVIVGRDEKDNEALETFGEKRWMFRSAETEKTPLVLADGIRSQKDIETVSRITARYCKPDHDPPFSIQYKSKDDSGTLSCMPAEEDYIEKWRV
jgi:hypothetical protein